MLIEKVLTKLEQGNSIREILFEQAVDNSEYFETELKKVQSLLSKSTGSVEMSNGQRFEKYTLKEMIWQLQEVKDAGELFEDNVIQIKYTNGKEICYHEGDATGDLKLSGISAVIWDSADYMACAGKGIRALCDDTRAGLEVWKFEFV